MKKLFLASMVATLTALFLFACSTDTGSCTKDSDCKGNRVCQYGECVDTTSTTPTGNPNGYACGVTDIACNCAATTAYAGQVTSTSLCQSGKHQFFVCPGTCGGGAPWYTVCYC